MAARRVLVATNGCASRSAASHADHRRNAKLTSRPSPPGATSASRRMRSACVRSSICATPPPNEWPTRSNDLNRKASTHDPTIAACHSTVYGASGRSDSPCPGRSGISTRRDRPSAGAIVSQVRCESHTPCNSTVGRPRPISAQWMWTPWTRVRWREGMLGSIRPCSEDDTGPV